MALSGELTINLGAIAQNYQTIDNISANSCETAVCVKADAYGLGIIHVAPALYRAGAQRFFVANLDEGIELRGIISSANIYILNGFYNPERYAYREYNLIPVLNSLSEIASYKAFAYEADTKLPAIIHFDTGMNRLGLPSYEAEILCADKSLIDGIDLQYIMSHFSSSEEKDSPLNAQQYQIFSKIRKHFKSVKASLCNSGGVLLSPDYHMDLTRIGIALYNDNVVSLGAPVLQIKSVKKGEAAGYNGTYIFEKDTNIATIAIGYADGILRSLENGGALYWNGYRLPIRGRVSMDLVICDLSEVPEEGYPDIGDVVEIIGKNQSVDDLAKSAGTISYEILTSLGSRYKRSYIS